MEIANVATIFSLVLSCLSRLYSSQDFFFGYNIATVPILTDVTLSLLVITVSLTSKKQRHYSPIELNIVYTLKSLAVEITDGTGRVY